jgi:hypothetical protein
MPVRAGVPYQPYSFLVKKLNGLIVAQDDKGAIRFSGTDASTVIQYAVDALPNGGTVFLKEVQLPDTVEYGNNILIIQDYQGERIIYSKQGRVITPRLAADPDTTGWGAAEKGRRWFNTTDNKEKFWDGSQIQSIPSVAGGVAYELPANYVVFIEGSTVKAQNGHTGNIDYSGTDASTVIQQAIDGLTSGRTWREKVVLKGNFNLNKQSGKTYAINVPTYTILDLSMAKLYLNNGQNCDVIQVTGAAGSSPREHSVIIGGVIDCNKAYQTSGNGIVIWKGSASKIYDTVIYNAYQDGLRYTGESWSEWSGLHEAYNVRVYNAGRYGIYGNYHSDNFYHRCVVQSSSVDGVFVYGVHRFYYCHVIYAGRYAFYLHGNAFLVECDADTPTQHGIYLNASANYIHGGYVHAVPSGYNGIVLAADTTRNIIRDVYFSGGGTMNYAVNELTGGDYNIVSDCLAYNVTQTTAFNKTGTNSQFYDNFKF